MVVEEGMMKRMRGEGMSGVNRNCTVTLSFAGLT